MILNREPVGVTGIGVICAAGRNVDEFWTNLQAGTSAVRKATQGELAHRDDAFVGEVPDEWIEAQFSTAERARLDRASLLSVEAMRQALSDAGLDPGALPTGRTGLVVGKCQGQSARTDGTFAQIHATCDDVAGYFGTSGPRVVVSTACAAGGNAVGIARDKLWRGEADVVLAGGVDILLEVTFVGFGALQALAGAPCAPYSRSDGLSLGEGAAFLVVERVRDAEARGRPVLAYVRGYGLSADAYHPTAPDPTGRGAVSAVERALDDAGATAGDVSYVNGHGTGTPTNDRMERKAMRLLFGERARDVPISGTKSFVGHTLGASGAVEAIACVLAIRDGIVPPTANFGDTGGEPGDLDFVPHRARSANVDLTVSNNYAFGGNNASLVLSRPDPSWVPADPLRASSSTRLAVTGFGPVGPMGVGIDEWRERLAAGRSALAPLSGAGQAPEHALEGSPSMRAALMERLRTKPFADPKQWRQLSELCRQCVAATKLALDDAGLRLDRSYREQLGTVFATGFGPMHDALSFDSDRSTSPKVSAFANITMNAPAGAVCRALGVRGPTTTITTGATSFFHGLSCAADLIGQAKTSAVVVLAADELSLEILQVRQALGDSYSELLSPSGEVRPYGRDRDGTCPGHAVVACVVENYDDAVARGAPIYAELASCTTLGAAPSPTGEPYATTMQDALDRADVSAADIGYCSAMAGGHDMDAVEARALAQCLKPSTLLSAPRTLTGDCEAASGAVNLLCAALAVSCGGAPPLPTTSPTIDDLTLTPLPPDGQASPVGHALATGMDAGGNYAAAVLAAVEGGRR